MSPSSWIEVFCIYLSSVLSQALCSTNQGPSPLSRQDVLVNIRGLSWRWSAIFTPPGTSKTMTSVTADGWEMAACGFPLATPGDAAEAFPRQGCAHLDSLTRRHTFTEPIAIGNLKGNPKGSHCDSELHDQEQRIEFIFTVLFAGTA